MNRRRLLVAAQAAVSVALLAWLFRGLDLAAFRALFARLPLSFYLLSLAVVVAGQAMYAWRWRLLLVASGVAVSMGTVLRQYFIGIFLNNFLPSTVGGDLAKVYYLGRQHGYRPVAASVVLDRLLGIGLLALLASCAQLAVRPASAPERLAGALTGAIAALALFLLVVAVHGTGGLPRRVERLGPRLVALAARLQRFRRDMAAAAARPIILAKALAVILLYFVMVTAVYQGFIRLTGETAPPLLALFAAVTTTSVLSNVPVSLNGLGLREQLHVVLLQPLGVPLETAVAISLLLYGHLLLASVGGMVVWARSPGVGSRGSGVGRESGVERLGLDDRGGDVQPDEPRRDDR